MEIETAYELAEQVIYQAKKLDIMLSVAESCTGGMVAAFLTSIPGSSAIFDRGFVTYSNLAKHEMLGVPNETLQQFGAVSSQTAIAMANGALKNSIAKVAVSVTGIAGPGGGSIEKPVGLVHFGVAKAGSLCRSYEHRFEDAGRGEIRDEAARMALSYFLRALQ